MKRTNFFKSFSLSIIYLWLAIFAMLPICLVLITSFLQHTDNKLIIWQFNLHNYTQLFEYIYFRILLQSMMLAFSCTFFTLIIGYPAAFAIAHTPRKWRNLLLIFIIIPFWTSSLIRTYAIMAIIKAKGLLNTILLGLGIIHHPLQILYTNTAILLGCIYDLLPFMILPLYANIEKLDARLIEAARDLGANRWQLFSRIILPLTKPGIVAGSLLVFLPAMTLFYIPVLLGGAKSLLLGNLIQNQFLAMRDWPGGAATSIILTLFMLLLILLYRRIVHGKQREELLV